jgi:acyl carrier protein
MRSQTAENLIREFILKSFPLARKAGLKNNDKLLETGMIDSLGVLDLVHYLEEEFSVVISDEDLQPENFDSVESVTAFVGKKIEFKQ